MKAYVLLLLLLLAGTAKAQPQDDSSFEIQEVQFYFGNITDLKCCRLLKEKEQAPFDGFLLQPYQLVFLKDTLDSWQEDLVFQLNQNDILCNEKISICQENRSLLLDETKKEALFYSDLSTRLNSELVKIKSEYNLFKIITYISIPVVVSLGAYLTYKY